MPAVAARRDQIHTAVKLGSRPAGASGMASSSVFNSKRRLDSRGLLRIHRATAAGPFSGHRPAGRQSAIPWGVVGMAGLVLAIESWVARNWLDFSDPVSLSWRFSASAAKTRAPGCDLVCLGDSLSKHGLFPAVIEHETGRRAVNLSAARAPTLLSYFLLRRTLDSGARPSAVVLNAKPAVLIGGPEYDARYWQEVLTPRESIELLRMTGRVPFMVSTFLGRLLPSFRSRLEVRSNVLAALRGETDRIHAMNRILWRNWTANAGANVVAPDSRYHGEVTPEVERKLHTSSFHVDRTNAEAIERLMKLAAGRRIPVFWLLTPLAPNLQALRDQSGAEARYEQFVRSIQARYPQVMTVLDARRAAYPPKLFIDATHLNAQGGVALSGSVATKIAAELARPGSTISGSWIKLDPPSDRSGSFQDAIEDIDESRSVLQLDVIASESSH
jgi:hypothetical protein